MATVAELEEHIKKLTERINTLEDKQNALATSHEALEDSITDRLARLEDDFDASNGTREYEKEFDKKGNFVKLTNPEDNVFAVTVDANGDVIRDPNVA